MKKPLATGALFSIIWRSWTLGVLLIFVPVTLLGLPVVLANQGVAALGQFSLILLFVPFAAALQGAILAVLICLGYALLPGQWLGLSGTDAAADGTSEARTARRQDEPLQGTLRAPEQRSGRPN